MRLLTGIRGAGKLNYKMKGMRGLKHRREVAVLTAFEAIATAQGEAEECSEVVEVGCCCKLG